MFNITKRMVSEDEQINLFYFYEKEQFLLLWVLFITIVVGNVSVLIILHRNRKRRSRVNMFIQHLAIADLSIGIVHVLVDIIWRMTVSWLAGDLLCRLIKYLQCLVTYASNYILVALSIDRFGAIVQPMSFSKRARWLLFSSWLISAIFSLPQLFLYEVIKIQGHTQCWIEFDEQWHWQLYMTLVSLFLFFIPVTIIACCYGLIIKKLWKRGSRRCATNDVFNGSLHRECSRGVIPRAKVKIVKMTFLIVVVFIGCWSPYVIFDLLQVYEQIPKSQTYVAIATFVQSLAALNSATNPLIYCIFSLEVPKIIEYIFSPKHLPKMCCCCGYCREDPPETPEIKFVIAYQPDAT